jgi:poly-gamma-glutamate capsule biosynthesis protein CapA/YwtB (metallophosphatase superfamily)
MNRRTFMVTSGCAALGAATIPLVAYRDTSPITDGARLVIGGDVCHAESYPTGGARVLETRSYAYSFEALAPLTKRADYAVVNLETPVTAPVPEWALVKDYVHWTSPESLKALADIGVDAVGLANNHILDYGRQGLAETFKAVRDSGLKGFGSGVDEAQAALPLLLKLPSASGPVNIAIFAMFEYRRPYADTYDFYAKGAKSGTNLLSIERFTAQVAELRRKTPDVFVIAYPHWGPNYAWRTASQKRIGRALIDGGADIVIGHHGHAMQEIERHNGKWIFYGIGNFMFNAPGRFDENPNVPPFGLAVELNINSKGDATPRLYPINSDNSLTDYRPTFANPKQAAKAFVTLLKQSKIDLNAAGITTGTDNIGTYMQL